MLSDIYGAANFSSLGPILSVPVALVLSIFFKYFSTFSSAMLGMEKDVFSDNLSLQNLLSVSKLEDTIGYFIFEVTDTKNLLNSLAMSLEFSIILSLTFNENMLVLNMVRTSDPLAQGHLGPWNCLLNKLSKEPLGHATY